MVRRVKNSIYLAHLIIVITIINALLSYINDHPNFIVTYHILVIKIYRKYQCISLYNIIQL